MLFITLSKFKGKATKEAVEQSSKLMKQVAEEGVKILGMYWTLGRFDSVFILEAKDEKTVMKALLQWGDWVTTETLVAVTREEAFQLLQ